MNSSYEEVINVLDNYNKLLKRVEKHESFFGDLKTLMTNVGETNFISIVEIKDLLKMNGIKY